MNLLARAKLSVKCIFAANAKPSFSLLPFATGVTEQCNCYATKASQKTKQVAKPRAKKASEQTGSSSQSVKKQGLDDAKAISNRKVKNSSEDTVKLKPGVKAAAELTLESRDEKAKVGKKIVKLGENAGTEKDVKAAAELSRDEKAKLGKKIVKLGGNAGTEKDVKAEAELSRDEKAKLGKKIVNLGENAGTEKDVNALSYLWRDVLRNPQEWYDYRSHKSNGLVPKKHPDFKQKGSGALALWLSSAPDWVLPKFVKLKFDVTDVPLETRKEAKGASSWKSFAEDPSKWWDNRLRKTGPRAPDFVHKSSKEALWLRGAPSWVLPVLENFGFISKDVLEKEEKEPTMVSLWRDIVDNPHRWYDYRSHKAIGSVKEKYPDFLHKDSRAALWIHNAPSWVLPRLKELEFDVPIDLWKSLVEEPSKWWDNRFCKTSPKAPDFWHRESKKALWLINAPSWVLPKLSINWGDKSLETDPEVPELLHEESKEGLPELKNLRGEIEAEGSGKSLLDDPSKWCDNRSGKETSEAPDFTHKESKEALWIDSAPSSVLPELEKLGPVAGDLPAKDEKEAEGGDSQKSGVEDTGHWSELIGADKI